MSRLRRRRVATTLGALILGLGGLAAFGDESSSSFLSRPSGYGQGGSKAASASFNDAGSIEDAGGHGQASSSFRGRSGFVAGQPAPSTVADLTVNPLSPTQVTLSWTAPYADAERSAGAVAFYVVRYSSTGAISTQADFDAATTVTQSLAAQAPLSAESFSVDSLLPGAEYSFALAAVNEDGVMSAPSNAVSITMAYPAGCEAAVTVAQGGGAQQTTIQGGVDALGGTLSGHTCVLIQDGATYAEQVTVQNFTNNGSSLTIMANPESGMRPVVSNPSLNAAFTIKNASVNIVGLEITGAGGTYAVDASSPLVKLSSLSITQGAMSAAVILRDDWATVEYTSVTAGNARALDLRGDWATVRWSTAVNAGTTGAAFHLTGADSATVTGLYARNAAAYYAAALDGGSHHNAVSGSTFVASGLSGFAALILDGADDNSFHAIVSTAPEAAALRLQAGADRNSVTASSLAATSAGGGVAVWIAASSGNLVSGSWITNTNGYGVALDNDAWNNAIERSTVVASHSGSYAFALLDASSNAVDGIYVENPVGTAGVLTDGSILNTVSRSTFVTNAAGHSSFFLYSADSNTVTDSLFLSTGSYAFLLNVGADRNTVRRSTAITHGAGVVSFYAIASSSNAFEDIYSQSLSGYAGAFQAGASYNSVSRSTFVVSAAGYYSFAIDASTANIFDGVRVENRAGTALAIYNGAHRNEFRRSTAAATGGSGTGFYAQSVSSLTLVSFTARSAGTGYAAHFLGVSTAAATDSFFDAAAASHALYADGVSGLEIRASTLTATTSATAAFEATASSAITLSRSYARARRGVWIKQSTNSVIAHSYVEGVGSAYSGLLFTDRNVGILVASNTIRGGDEARGVYIDAFGGGANMGLIHVVTNTISGAAAGVEIGNAAASARVFVASNTIHPVQNTSVDAAGVYLYTLPGGATVQNNSVYYRAPGSMGGFTTYGFAAADAPGLLFSHNRINNPGMVTGGSFTGLRLNNSPSASILNNDMHSTGTALTNAFLVRVLSGSTGARFHNNAVSSSFTVSGTSATIEVDAASVAGFLSDYNLAHSSNDFKSGLWAGNSLSMLDGSWMFVTGNDENSVGYFYPGWRSMTAGSEDFHLQSRAGRWTPSGWETDNRDSEGLDGARPADAVGLESAPNGGRMNIGSYGGTDQASRSEATGCATLRRVNQAYGPYTDITFALSALWYELSGPTCVQIQDSATYPEQVTVQNFTNNGSSITIFTDPAAGSYAVVDPPAGSTAAFHILNASVSLAGIVVRPTGEAVAHGVYASSSIVSLSSVSVDSGGMIWRAGVMLASYSTVSDSSVTVQSAHALRFEGSVGSLVARSTASATGSAFNGLYINGGSANRVERSWVYNASGYGCVIVSDDNVIESSTISVSGNGYGCEFDGDRNSILRSYMFSFNGAAFSNFASGTDNLVDLSTAVGAIGAQIGNGDSNRLQRSVFEGRSGRGIEVNASAGATVIAFSTAIGSTQGLLVRGSSTTVYNSYIQGSTAVFVNRSTGTDIRDSVLYAVGAAGEGVHLASGSVNFALSSTSVRAPALGRGVRLEAGNTGVVSLASVTITGASRGIEASEQGSLFALSVDSINFRGLATGATALHFLGGTFVATITAAGFEDSSIGANVSASALDGASRITMRGQSGARTGTAYENDPQGLVWWEGETTPYPGCVETREVGAGKLYATIQAAVNALPSALTGRSCVVIRDAATYPEQVTVQNFDNQGSSITIFTDPAVGSYAVVDPPAGSTAAFHILNASVTVYGIAVRPTVETVSYGVYASSPIVTVSSLSVDSGGRISVAGLSVSSWGVVSHSSVTVQNARALVFRQSVGTTVSYSSFQAAGSAAAVYFDEASSNTFTVSLASNSAGKALELGLAFYNTVSLSSANAAADGDCALCFDQSGWNALDRLYVQNANGYGLAIWSDSNWNTVTDATASAKSVSYTALLVGGSSNTLTRVKAENAGWAMSVDGGWNQVVDATARTDHSGSAAFYMGGDGNQVLRLSADNPSGTGAWLDSGADHNSLAQSTMTGTNSSYYALRLAGASSNTLTGLFAENTGGNAIGFETGAAFNTLSLSTMISGGVNRVGLLLDASPDNALDRIYSYSAAGAGAYLANASHRLTIAGSTFTSSAASYRALLLDNVNDSLITASVMRNDAGSALEIYGARDEVRLSTVVASAYGLRLIAATTVTVTHSYLQGSTAAFVSQSTGSRIESSALSATAGAGDALFLTGGSVNLTLSSSSLAGGSSGRGLALDSGNAGAVSLGSVTFSAAGRAVTVSTQAANFDLLVDSVQFRSLASGATAIHFLGGTFVATITAAGFEDSSIGANVSAAALDGVSRLTMRGSKGSRHGPAFENDPASLVDWPDLGAPAAPALWFVASSSGGLTYGTVGADGYTVQASTAADFTGVVHSSTAFNGEDRLAPTTLDPNTTYYFRAGALWGGGTVYAQTTVSTPTLANLVSATTTYQIFVTSVVINWSALPLSPPDASSKTSEGYLLQVADDIAFTNIVASSFTPNPALSTLTVNGLYGDATYYFRVGTLNWSGAAHYAVHHATYLPPILGVDLTTISVVVPGGTPMNAELVVTTATVVTNTGNVNANYHLRVTTVSAGSPWFVGASPHSDRYAAWAVFNSTQPAAGDFDATDQLADGETECSAAFTMGNEDCEQVPPGETRTLWMKIWTPLVTTTGDSQDIRLIVRPEYAR